MVLPTTMASRQYSVSLRTAVSRAVGGYEKTRQIEDGRERMDRNSV